MWGLAAAWRGVIVGGGSLLGAGARSLAGVVAQRGLAVRAARHSLAPASQGRHLRREEDTETDTPLIKMYRHFNMSVPFIAVHLGLKKKNSQDYIFLWGFLFTFREYSLTVISLEMHTQQRHKPFVTDQSISLF